MLRSVFKMSGSSSEGNISPKSSSSSSNDNVKQLHFKSKYPPPYWKEKIAKNYNILRLLELNMDLRYALHKSPTLAEEFMKHPDVSREVARDKRLATEIIRRPHLLEELANFHHYAHQQKRRKKIKEFVRKLEREYIAEHYKDEDGLVIPVLNKDPAIESQMSMAIARATLPNIAISTEDPPYVKYIMDSGRLFMRHDVVIEHACCCANKKVHYYNVLNEHGRLLYRVFRHHQQSNDNPRPYELIVKDPDGSTICIFAQIRDKLCRRKLSVQYPPHKVIGYVEQKWCCSHKPNVYIKNKELQHTILIECTQRPLLSHCRYHPKFNFELKAVGTHNVLGKISCEWIDTTPGAFESARIYGVSFPKDLTLEVKLTILAAWILIYINYFNGKLKTIDHYTLTDEEKALIRLVEDSEDEKVYKVPPEPSSDSDASKDQAIMDHYRKSFEVAAISAKKKVGIDNIVDFNKK